MIAALYHAPHEHAGLIGKIIQSNNLPLNEYHLYRGDALPAVSEIQGLVVMGGPMSVNDTDKYQFLTPEINLIEKTLNAKKPVLGICLGAQLMAKALGSRVYANVHRELGWHHIQLTAAAATDPLFRTQATALRVFHWHGETFDLPSGAVHLAKSDRCVNQAFRWGDNSYGFQFHFEVTPAMVKQWCSSPEGAADVRAAGETVAEVIAKTPSAYQALEPVAQIIFDRYLQLAYKTAPTLV